MICVCVCVCVYVCVHALSHLSCVWLFATYRLWSARLLCPWDSPGKNTRVGCHALLQGIFQPRDWTQVSCISCIAGIHTHTHTHTHYMYIDISIYTHTYIHTHTHIIHKWPTCYNFTHELDYLAGDPKRPAGYSYIEAISISYSTILHLFFLSLTDCWATDQINSSVIWLIAWWIKA